MKSWASRAGEDAKRVEQARTQRWIDDLPKTKRRCKTCGEFHRASEREIFDAFPARAAQGECRKIEFPEGVTVIDTMVFNGRLIAATDGGVFEVIDGVAVLLKPEMPA